ncbi:Vacuolar protein-sorting-associated protein 36 [Aphelenchoides besseyi]|nr:Vacuolar protein-sorting-associated protein 36 [Aphelenchoides besseyi]
MDRLSWYQPGESMEEILCQAGHVGIYDGDLKQSAFEQGTASLTLQRVIWADSSDPDCRLILHHSFVDKIERQHKTMFGRGGKIIVTLKPVGNNHIQGPVASSGFNSLRFVFKNGGEEDFYKRYADALSRGTWKRTSSSSSSAGSRNSHVHSGSISGQSGQRAAIPTIEKRISDQHNKIQESISQVSDRVQRKAFDEMSKLMEHARDMVNLSKSITERLRVKQFGDVTDDEVTQFKTYLLNLGISDGSESMYFLELARDLNTILVKPLKECGGAMSLAEAFCWVNRCRDGPLISPEDLSNACNYLEEINASFRIGCFDDGVVGLQLMSIEAQDGIAEIVRCVEKLEAVGPEDVSAHVGVDVALAMDRLLIAESEALVCRDETIDGIIFYPNKFQGENKSQTNETT